MSYNSIFFEEGEEHIMRVNPLYGQRIIDCDDFSPHCFDAHGLNEAFSQICGTTHDFEMLCESASFEEVDDYYNPGTEEIPDSDIFEAVVIDKFSRTGHRMAAVVRTFRKHLKGNSAGIEALDPIVGKPKKAGSFAYVTVQLPFSDGQVVSVIFHAPEGDKRKIGPDDTIIAFRWLLNRRDITQLVSPEDGSEVSLETIAMRVTQLVVKNSARFERTQKEAEAERKELEDTREALKEAEAKQAELMDQVADTVKESQAIDAELSNTLALLEKQKGINAELRAKLKGMQEAEQKRVEPPAGGSPSGAGADEQEEGGRAHENDALGVSYNKEAVQELLHSMSRKDIPATEVKNFEEIKKAIGGDDPQKWLSFVEEKITLQGDNPLIDPLGNQVFLRPGNTENIATYAQHLIAGLNKPLSEARESRVVGVYLLNQTIEKPLAIVEQKPKKGKEKGRKLYLALPFTHKKLGWI